MFERLVFLLLFISIACNANASLLQVGTGQASPGSTIMIPFYFTNDQNNITAIDIKLMFDPSKVEPGTIYPGIATTDSDKELMADSNNAPGTLGFHIIADIFGNFTGAINDGEIATVPFLVKSGAASGTMPITVTVSTGAKQGLDGEFEKVAVPTIAGSILINGDKVIVRGIGYGTITAAYAAAVSEAEIKCLNAIFTENLYLDLEKAVILNGGYADGFSVIDGATTVLGSLTVAQGSVTMDNIIIR